MNVLFMGKAPQPLRLAREHTHPCWEIVVVTEGSGRVDTAREHLDFAAGTAYILPPHTPHAVGSTEGFMDVYLHADTLPFPAGEITCVRDVEELSVLADLMYTMHVKSRARYAASLSSLGDLIVQMITDRLNESGCHPLSLSLRDYLAQHLADPEITMQTLSAHFNYTDDHLRRCFKEDFATTPLDYLFDLRIRQAKRLLRQMPVWTVEEIARQCGFEDPLYFSRVFKKAVGVSPRQFRKE
ncbi:MAG: helix-turn-helix transcriptional regulator [Clostridia bacterium]|nr:helix-turn-helix transcriptional regulator [Clostridia bacterium]